MMPAGTQILVLKEGTRRERGKGAQFNNIAAAKAVADAVRSTLGPRGMDKMLVDSLGDVVITNDGVTILKEIDIEHPAAKMLGAVAEKRADDSYFVDDDNIQVVKKQGGSIADTAMVDGIIVDKERVHPGMPGEVREGKIALIDAALEVKKTEIDAKIEITDPTQLQAFLNEEESMLKRMVETVRKSGANVLFCQKGIDDLAQHYLAKAEIYAVRRVKKSDMEKLAKATGGKVVTKLDELAKDDLGYAKLVYEKKIGEDEMTFVTGCKNPKAVSILIRGGTEHVVDEVERSLEDATSGVAVAIEDGKVITGGGSSAMEIALALRDFASTVGGREQIAIEAFADAVEVIPRTLA